MCPDSPVPWACSEVEVAQASTPAPLSHHGQAMLSSASHSPTNLILLGGSKGKANSAEVNAEAP